MRITFEDAAEIVQFWLGIVNKYTTHKRAVLMDQTVSKPYGWMFLLQHERFVAEGDPAFILYGGQPAVVITRSDAAVHVLLNLGGRHLLENWEATEGARYVRNPDQ